MLKIRNLRKELFEEIVGRISIAEMIGHLLQSLQDQIVDEQRLDHLKRLFGDFELLEIVKIVLQFVFRIVAQFV